MKILISVLVWSFSLAAFAAPSKTTLESSHAVVEKRTVCTPTSLGDTEKDDTPAIKAAITSCGNGGTIMIPAGVTYSLRTMLDFTGCVNCDFQLEGTLKASDDTTYWATQAAFIYVNAIKGANLRSLTGSGVIDGNGQSSYDQFSANSSLVRPTALYILGGSSNIAVTGLTVKNPPNVFIAQKGAVTNVAYASLIMTAASKSTNAPKNTDGFDIGESTYTTIDNVHITNQDDCIAFKPGANYVTVTEVTCQGSHGLSVGSLAKTNADSVKNIYVSGATMINSTKAAGIKLYEGGSAHGTATVTNVTWDGVTVNGCGYAFQVQSCYGSEDDADCEANPSAAVLDQIYIKNFSGTTSSQYEPVTANINCPPSGTCNLQFTDWSVATPSGSAKILCDNIDGSPGITCVSGASG